LINPGKRAVAVVAEQVIWSSAERLGDMRGEASGADKWLPFAIKPVAQKHPNDWANR
jgi:hypothetical protein